jgi:hypothetical protein
LGIASGDIRGWLKRIQESSDLLKLLAEPAGETLDADFIIRSEQLRVEREQLIAQLRRELESERKKLAAGVRLFERDPKRLQLARGPFDCPAIRTYESVNGRLDDYRRVPESV